MFPLILFYLILTIIRPQDYIQAMAGIPLLPLVLVLAFVFWIVSSARTIAAPQFLLLPAFLLVAMFSQVTNGWVGGALDVMIQFGPIVIAFFVLAACCDTPQRTRTAMVVFVLCSMVLAAHGVEQARTGIGWTGMTIGEHHRIRYVGIFNDPNDLGLLFAATMPLAFYLGSRQGFLRRVFWFSGAALILYGVYLTNSRGAMLSVLAVAGVYVWRRRGLLTAAVIGLGGLTVMKLLSSRMQELDVDESSAYGRVDAWYAGLHMFFSRPLFGIGAGNFTDYNYLTAHNSFVLVLAETGFIGYTLWLAFVGYAFWMMLTILRHNPELGDDPQRAVAWRNETAMAFAWLLSLCGMFVSAFFLSRSYMVVLYLFLATVVGYYVGVRRRHAGLPEFKLADGWWRWIVASLGSIFVLYVMVAVMLRLA